MKRRHTQGLTLILMLVVGLLAAACGGRTSTASGKLIKIDGSSTVFPIMEAMAEEFQRKPVGARIIVGISGTGGGFKKFCNNETDLSNASRQIKGTEKELCQQNGVEYIELEVAFDGLSTVVNPQNTWAQCLTTAELKRIWEPNSAVNNWKDIRAGFPDVPLKLYGPGTDSGTFDYFTEAINGKEKASRADFQASEDDNVLVQGVAGDVGALGYFGYAYYEENKNRLKLLGVDAGQGCVEPSAETVQTGTYKPLSRPLYVYVRKSALARTDLRAFVEYFFSAEGRALVPEAGYIALPRAKYEAELKKIADVK